VPLECVTADRGKKVWRLGEGRRRPPLSFTYEEAAALYLGRQFLEPMAGSPFWSAAQSAWQKIRSTLGEMPMS
jgi:proteasome accessory factor B